jgi:hypothetical protein
MTKRMLKIKVENHRKTPVFKYIYGSGYILGGRWREMVG